jgi:hypothetical protein
MLPGLGGFSAMKKAHDMGLLLRLSKHDRRSPEEQRECQTTSRPHSSPSPAMRHGLAVGPRLLRPSTLCHRKMTVLGHSRRFAPRSTAAKLRKPTPRHAGTAPVRARHLCPHRRRATRGARSLNGHCEGIEPQGHPTASDVGEWQRVQVARVRLAG